MILGTEARVLPVFELVEHSTDVEDLPAWPDPGDPSDLHDRKTA